MMRRVGGEKNHAIAGVFVFLLLGVFAVFSTMLVLIGAQAYRTITVHAEEHNFERTMYSYILNSLRGDDVEGTIETRNEKGIDTLVVSYDYGLEIMEKRVYCYDGHLRELLTSASNEFEPANGEEICEAESFRASLTDNLITIDVTGADGELRTINAVLRTYEVM